MNFKQALTVQSGVWIYVGWFQGLNRKYNIRTYTYLWQGLILAFALPLPQVRYIRFLLRHVTYPYKMNEACTKCRLHSFEHKNIQYLLNMLN